jgi:hypothetical protein
MMRSLNLARSSLVEALIGSRVDFELMHINNYQRFEVLAGLSTNFFSQLIESTSEYQVHVNHAGLLQV